MRSMFRTVVKEMTTIVIIMLAFSALYIIASLLLKGHVDWK